MITEQPHAEAFCTEYFAATTPQSDWNEILLFIHGITPQARPGRAEESYNKLLKLLRQEMRPEKRFDQTHILPISWGSGCETNENSLFEASYADQYVAEVERRIARKVKPQLGDQQKQDPGVILPIRFLAQLFRVRDTLLHGIPDLFFYISADGEKVIRNRVFKSIGNSINQIHQHTPDCSISLTLIGHSAGSIIAHDFLYQLFGKSSEQIEKDQLDEDKRQASAEVAKLRQLKQAGKLRLRRFYTLGSPLTALMIRSNSLIERMMRGADGDCLDPKDLGLERDDTLPGPRWLNFWDVDDYASFPVEPFYKYAGEVVKDEYIDHGWSPRSDIFPMAHEMYWESESVAKKIAENF